MTQELHLKNKNWKTTETFAHTSINLTYYIYTCINILINIIIKMDKLSVAPHDAVLYGGSPQQ